MEVHKRFMGLWLANKRVETLKWWIHLSWIQLSLTIEWSLIVTITTSKKSSSNKSSVKWWEDSCVLLHHFVVTLIVAFRTSLDGIRLVKILQKMISTFTNRFVKSMRALSFYNWIPIAIVLQICQLLFLRVWLISSVVRPECFLSNLATPLQLKR